MTFGTIGARRKHGLRASPFCKPWRSCYKDKGVHSLWAKKVRYVILLLNKTLMVSSFVCRFGGFGVVAVLQEN